MLSMTYGWFTILFTLPTGEVGVGELKYTPTGSFVSSGGIYIPGEEIVDTPFSVDNESTIDSQLRIQIIYTKVTNNSGTITSEDIAYTASSTDAINVTMSSSLYGSGEYFYYLGDQSVIAKESGIIDLVSSIYYDGDYTGIDYSGEQITVTLKIQVKQADNVTWSELTEYDFEAGN